MIIDRPSYLEKLKRYKDKDLIKVITGVRRCGKSVLLFDIYYHYLLDSGISEDRIIRVNLENDVKKHLRDSEALYRHISDAMIGKDRHYVTIDEIQYIDGFEDLVNSLKNNNCDVYIVSAQQQSTFRFTDFMAF